MNEESKKISQEIKEEIKKANKILLSLHPGPDGDSVGGNLALKFALESMGKEVTLIKGDSDKPHEFVHLPGFEDISDLSLKEVNQSDFDLIIAIDSSSPDMVSQKTELSPDLKVVVIDHHITNTKYGDINFVLGGLSSVCEVLFKLFTDWKVPITKEIASNLFCGLFTDTGGFKYPSATKDTFLTAASLVEKDPDFWKIIFELENQNEEGHVTFRALALNSIEHFFGNRVAMSVVPFSAIEKKHISPSHTANQDISNYLKSVKGWELGISVFEKEPDHTYVSFRTRNPDQFDVSKIASELGGGGHKPAAGALIKDSAENAKQAILKAIEKVYPELVEKSLV